MLINAARPLEWSGLHRHYGDYKIRWVQIKMTKAYQRSAFFGSGFCCFKTCKGAAGNAVNDLAIFMHSYFLFYIACNKY
jgi:hypothetical protein